MITVFAVDDAPDEVCRVLNEVGRRLPQLRSDGTVSTVAAGALQYKTLIPLHSPADDFSARSTFLRWTWYASRRAGLHLDEAEDEFETSERVEQTLRLIAPTLRLSAEDQQDLAPYVRLTRYGTDEIIQVVGQVPKKMTFVVAGTVQLAVADADDLFLPVLTLEQGDFLGQTALTREPVITTAYALTEVTVAQFDRECIEDLVARKPVLLQDIGRAIEERRASVKQALGAAAR